MRGWSGWTVGLDLVWPAVDAKETRYLSLREGVGHGGCGMPRLVELFWLPRLTASQFGSSANYIPPSLCLSRSVSGIQLCSEFHRLPLCSGIIQVILNLASPLPGVQGRVAGAAVGAATAARNPIKIF